MGKHQVWWRVGRGCMVGPRGCGLHSGPWVLGGAFGVTFNQHSVFLKHDFLVAFLRAHISALNCDGFTVPYFLRFT